MHLRTVISTQQKNVYLVEFAVVAVVVDEVGVAVGAEPSSLATLVASWEEEVGTSYEEEEHGAELEDSLDQHQELEAEGEIPHHYSAVASSSEGVLVSYERAWHG